MGITFISRCDSSPRDGLERQNHSLAGLSMFMSCRRFDIDTYALVHTRNLNDERKSILVGKRFRDHPCRSFKLRLRLLIAVTPCLGKYFYTTSRSLNWNSHRILPTGTVVRISPTASVADPMLFNRMFSIRFTNGTHPPT